MTAALIRRGNVGTNMYRGRMSCEHEEGHLHVKKRGLGQILPLQKESTLLKP